MGNLYRFAEPIVLVSLARLGTTYGYQIAQEAERLAVTHAGLDAAAIYRTLRRLEDAGYVNSTWDTRGPGPARRDYVLTEAGWAHLREWAEVLEDFLKSLRAVLEQCREAVKKHDEEHADQ
ncbi:MAG: helix-turn-helix transcriptional regulator [Bacillota bacterium]|nr:helix-turn-helix transcriptional regulator [Bacillota bacterium]